MPTPPDLWFWNRPLDTDGVNLRPPTDRTDLRRSVPKCLDFHSGGLRDQRWTHRDFDPPTPPRKSPFPSPLTSPSPPPSISSVQTAVRLSGGCSGSRPGAPRDRPNPPRILRCSSRPPENLVLSPPDPSDFSCAAACLSVTSVGISSFVMIVVTSHITKDEIPTHMTPEASSAVTTAGDGRW